jgi:hypothetical protein
VTPLEPPFRERALNTAGSLTIVDCVTRHFAYDGSNKHTGNGILVSTFNNSKFFISRTIALDNGYAAMSANIELFIAVASARSSNRKISSLLLRCRT